MPRIYTDEQFGEGVSIQGGPVDAAGRDLESRFNNVPVGDMQRRMIPRTFVAGWSPQLEAGVIHHQFPFLNSTNRNDLGVAGDIADGVVAEVIYNDLRVKGSAADGINHVDDAQYVWTITKYFVRPVILHSLGLTLAVDHPSAHASGPYKNDWLWGAGARPSGYADGDSTKDLSVVASVASAFRPTEARYDDVVATWNSRNVASEAFSELPLPATPVAGFGYTNMVPDFLSASMGAETIHGVHINMDNLNVCIPERSRLRICVTIPHYINLEQSWGGLEPHQQAVTLTGVVLEEVR